MSRLERLLILSPKAADDFADIVQYSLETWGEAQAEAYRDILDKAPLAIQDNPQIGRGRPELSAQHLIFPGEPVLTGGIDLVGEYRFCSLTVKVRTNP
ncbi:type II toxin-antitoxin system RelE/ParE family toxin [Candidatus Thiodictyon syntrophicum]|jgi:toxin ParE1/3/4|uniref:Plasmid stabilization protein ParE n=1 Tax=Candidatus Thiodictyon syntrophicum TaxID=1166950 RepID=A0A2K8U9K1_9GAMM|nr:type II toxin-antitoxin system RelE/ParE family toxin [Candidatus Thiodictyon syntrophicum]AUB82243.1 hypothetical protein THSYN_15660 [Candidatus Thiodictyon syntrophicum]